MFFFVQEKEVKRIELIVEQISDGWKIQIVWISSMQQKQKKKMELSRQHTTRKVTIG